MEEKKINNISSVCVYCASSTKIPRFILIAAKELGSSFGESVKRTGKSMGAGNIGFDVSLSPTLR